MCTIITADRETWDLHTTDFVDRIYEDAKYNSDGYSLIMVGDRADQVSVMRSLDIEMLLGALYSNDWQRFWLHTRHATGSARGLTATHAFSARYKGVEWFVMHNGVIRHNESNHFPVDSEWIANLISRYGPEAAINTVAHNETFANCFIVAPAIGKWYMLRLASGSLYVNEDGGNFSTVRMAKIIDHPVKEGSYQIHELKLEPAPSRYGGGSVYGTTTHRTPTESTSPKTTTDAAPSPASSVSTTTSGSTETTTDKATAKDGTRMHKNARRTDSDNLLGALANYDSSKKGHLGNEWIRTGRGVWVRQRQDVLFFSGTEPNDTRKKSAEVH